MIIESFIFQLLCSFPYCVYIISWWVKKERENPTQKRLIAKIKRSVLKCKAKQNQYPRLHLLKVKQVHILLKQQKPLNKNIILIIRTKNIINIASITAIETVKVIERKHLSASLGKKLPSMTIGMIYGLWSMKESIISQKW